MKETWKNITEYVGIYQISDQGKVRSLDRLSSDGRRIKGRILTQVGNGYGYYTVQLTNKGISKRYYIHRLVYEAFIGPILNGNDINHIDHNKGNNTPKNLESITHQANLKDQAIYVNGVYKNSHNYEGVKLCPNCGKPINYRSKLCKSCAGKNKVNRRKISYRIPKEDIINSLTKTNGNFTRSAREFNMSDNALRKWCKKYNLPYKSSEW